MGLFPLIPKEAKFFDLFEKTAANLETAAGQLVEFFQDYKDVPAWVTRFREMEHANDALTHQVMAQLHLTFVTPLDREDIALLQQKLDDVMDLIEGAVNTMQLYKIQQPTSRAKEQAAVLVATTRELSKAMPLLRKRGKMKQILEHCIEINRLENEADTIIRSALAELFEGMPVLEVIKWREIYEYLENAVDRCEDVADVLEGVVLKNA